MSVVLEAWISCIGLLLHLAPVHDFMRLIITQLCNKAAEPFTCCVFIPTARPTPPNVSTREVKDRTVAVTWRPAFDGGRPISRYSIEIKEEQREQKCGGLRVS